MGRRSASAADFLRISQLFPAPFQMSRLREDMLLFGAANILGGPRNRIAYTLSANAAPGARPNDQNAGPFLDACDRRNSIRHLNARRHAIALVGADYLRAFVEAETRRLVKLSADCRCQRFQSTVTNQSRERAKSTSGLELPGTR